MQLDRVIVCTNRRSDSISTRPNNQSILTCQSADKNNAPRDPPFYGPVTWNPDWTWPYSTVQIRLCLRLQSVKIIVSTAPLRQDPALSYIRYLTLAPLSALSVPFWQPFSTRFDSPVCRFDLNQLFLI